jgi:RNA polymerase sigma-70 factor (ECF subfamily)
MPPYASYQDVQLLALLTQGNRQAFTEIYSRHWEKMMSMAVKITRSEEEGRDIVQEIFVSVWNRREVLVVQGELIAYLLKSVRNLSLRYIERNMHRQDFLARLAVAVQHLDINTATDSQVEYKELQGKLAAAVAMLPEKMREIYRLSREEQLSHKEIAERLQIAETTVKKQISNALKLISRQLNGLNAGAIICLAHLLR